MFRRRHLRASRKRRAEQCRSQKTRAACLHGAARSASLQKVIRVMPDCLLRRTAYMKPQQFKG